MFEKFKSKTLTLSQSEIVILKKMIQEYEEEKTTKKEKSYDSLYYMKNLIITHQKKGICPSIASLCTLCDLSKNEIASLKKQLIEEGFLKTIGCKTYIIQTD